MNCALICALDSLSDVERSRRNASISSTNMIAGASFSANEKTASTSFCDSPNHLSIKVDGCSDMKLQSVSFARALISNVLPQPGGLLNVFTSGHRTAFTNALEVHARQHIHTQHRHLYCTVHILSLHECTFRELRWFTFTSPWSKSPRGARSSVDPSGNRSGRVNGSTIDSWSFKITASKPPISFQPCKSGVTM